MKSEVVGFFQDTSMFNDDTRPMCATAVVARTILASPPTLFDLWVSPTTRVPPVISIDMDPVPGGELRLSTGPAPADELTGHFIVVDRPNRLRYTWRWGGSSEESLVDVRFHAAGPATVVEVIHDGFLDEVSRQIHLDGWVHYLDSLQAFL